jgi:hypothetical protein
MSPAKAFIEYQSQPFEHEVEGRDQVHRLSWPDPGGVPKVALTSKLRSSTSATTAPS